MFSLILIFLIFSFASIFWAKNSGLATYWWLRILQGVILFLLIQKIDFRPVKAAWSLILAGLIQVFLAGHQLLTQRVFGSKWLGMAAQEATQAGTSVIETTQGRMLRLYGSFSHPNIFAGFLVFLVFVLFVLYFSVKKSWQKIFVLSVSPLITISLFLTYSRAAWLSLIINTIFLTVIIFKKSPRSFRIPFFEFFGLILIVVIIFSSISARDWVVRLEARGRLESKSISERLMNFQKGETIIKESFLLGAGVGNYTLAFYKKDSDLAPWDYQPVANIYLLILAELGLGGLILFLSMISFIFLRLGFNIYSPMLIGLLVIGFFDHWLFSLSFGILLFWLALGLVWKRCRIHELTGTESFF